MLKKAEMQQSFLKIGLLGFPGSGKSYTSANIAIGLHKHLKLKKPVAFFDTETGIDYLIPRFQKADIPLLEERARAFKSLMDVLIECDKGAADILIIDSITHVWGELMTAYKAKMGRNFLRINEWGILKQEFAQFTQLFLTSKVHIILCGRAGWDYNEETDEQGKDKLVKVGMKMKAESELGYEPSLLIEMDRVNDGDKTFRTATVIKDRTDLLDGKVFKNPKFEDFLPHLNFLNLKGKHEVLNTQATSEMIFDDPNWSSYELQKQKTIILEKIGNEFTKNINTRTDDGKKAVIANLEMAFQTNSWREVETMHIDKLKAGYLMLKNNIKVPAGKEK